MKTKILITIRGGNITDIMSNVKDAEIVIIDHDNADAGDKPVSDIMNPDYFVKDANGEMFYERFRDDEPMNIEIRDELKRMKF